MGSQFPFTLANSSLGQLNCLVDGESVVAKSGKRFDVIDPGSGKSWASCPDCREEDVDAAVQSSHRAFQSYSKWTPRQRAQTLLKWHQEIIAARDDLAKILVHETGKPLAEAYGEIDYATTFTWWFVGEAERVQGSSIVSAIPGRRAVTIKQPVGVAAALVPWNFPIALTLRKASAALAAGCTMIVKPSPETPITALSVARLALKAGFLQEHSTCLQRALKALGQLMGLKWRHAGQACVSSNRVYVQRGVYDKFADLVVNATAQLKMGHGMAEGTTLGPVTTPRSLYRAEEMAKDALAKGAKMVFGTGLRDASGSGGYFMEPTVLTNVTDDMLMSQDEIFAPLLGISVFDTEDEVIQRANNTAMGLTSYAFTKNVDRLWRLFELLEAGMVGLNTGNNSSAEAPFGGIKESGSGKESGKDVAIEEFMITKSGTFTIEGL
ncbi:hypothetical protein TrVFT333_009485 [Trichoderma virens FT-333]|nr:hypothetical protein TrVFT333_009485 [Trichoderma virens FT-333]